MGLKNYTLSKITLASFFEAFVNMYQIYLDRTSGLGFFRKAMLLLYTMVSIAFMLTALYLVLTKGFKY